MNAIIYAAGVARRLRSELGGLHKGLFKLGAKTLIERQLDWISSSSEVEEIVIVLGLEHEDFRDVIGTAYNGKPVNYVYNNEYKDKGNMLSLWAARDFCNKVTLFTTSDLICDPVNIEAFFDNKNTSKILIDCNQDLYEDPDPVKVKIVDRKIERLHKSLPVEQVNGLAIGVYQFSSSDIQKIIDKIEKCVNVGDDDLSLYKPIDKIMSELNTVPVFCKNSNWFDVDTPDELKYAISLLDENGNLNFGGVK